MYDPVLQRQMFANGGMAQAQPPMMQPPMMQQPMAQPPTSVGTGITSGLVDPAQEQVAAEQGFAAMAGGMQDMLGQIDAAESAEETINALRGDEASLEDRYAELAELVGNADAKKTPESVLALVQPTFTMMDMVQQESPAGGIADAMPTAGGGLLTGNIDMASPIQAPGMGEAVARMQAGEQPVTADVGGLQNDLVPQRNLNNMPPMGPGNTIPTALPVPDISGLPFIKRGLPKLEPVNTGNIQAYSNIFREQLNPYIQSMTGGAGPGFEQRMAMASDFLPKQKTSAEIMGEYDELLGTDSMDDAQTQAYLALVKAGQSIASSDKTLLGAAIDAAGEAAPTLSKIASEKSKSDRATKLAARQESIAQENEYRKAGLGMLNASISDASAANSRIENAILQVEQFAANKGIVLSEADRATNNKAIITNYQANQTFAVLPSETYAKINKTTGKTDLLEVYRDENGIRSRITEKGKFEPIEEGWVKYNKDAWKLANPNAAVDWSKAKLIPNMMIPVNTAAGDTPTLSGYKEVSGYDLNGKIVYIGKNQEKFDAPEGYFIGKEQDVYKVSDAKAGRVYLTFKKGVHAGKTILSTVDGEAIPMGYALQEPVYTQNADGSKTLESGNPMVSLTQRSGINFANMDDAYVAKTQRGISAGVKALNAGQKILKVIPDAVGPLATAKSFVSNNISMFVPDSQANWSKWQKTANGEQELKMFVKDVQQVMALSERFNQREQDIIAKMLPPEGGFFNSSEMNLVMFQGLMRKMTNDLAFRRSEMGDNLSASNQALQIDRVPSGGVNDPFIYSANNGHYDYLGMVASQGGNLEGKYIEVPANVAANAGQSVPQGAASVKVLITSLMR